MEVSILRVEGLQADLSIIGCYVSVDNKLYDVITPLTDDNPEAAVELPSTGQLRLLIKNISNDHEIIGSVSVDLSQLPQSGLCWLPLYKNVGDDQVLSLDEEAAPPRILVSLKEAVGFQLQKIEDLSTNAFSIAAEGLKTNPRRLKVEQPHIPSEVEKTLDGACEQLSQEKQMLMTQIVELSKSNEEALGLAERVNVEKEAEIARLKDEIEQMQEQKAADVAEGERMYRAALAKKDSEISKLNAALTEEVHLSSFYKEEFQKAIDELREKNVELKRLYNRADSDRLKLELQVKKSPSPSHDEPLLPRVCHQHRHSQSSLHEQNIQVERLVQENAALTEFKLRVERAEERRESGSADVEFREFIRKRGLDKVIVRQKEGEYLIDNYVVKTLRKGGTLQVEAIGGMPIVEELIGLALKNETTRSKLSPLNVAPTRRSTGNSCPFDKSQGHRRSNTEQLDLSLVEKSKLSEISYTSASRDECFAGPSKGGLRKPGSKPITTRNENDPASGNIHQHFDQGPSKTLLKATVSSLSKLRVAPASTTPLRDRPGVKLYKANDRSSLRTPFK
jgi:hypothetical protein